MCIFYLKSKPFKDSALQALRVITNQKMAWNKMILELDFRRGLFYAKMQKSEISFGPFLEQHVRVLLCLVKK
jgi:hypothetical protein